MGLYDEGMEVEEVWAALWASVSPNFRKSSICDTV